MAEKNRIDVELTERGLAESREKAKTLIMAGEVYVNNQKCDKPGTPVSKDDEIMKNIPSKTGLLIFCFL